MNVLGRHFIALKDARIPDETIQDVEHTLKLTLAKAEQAIWRDAVQDLVRDYVLGWTLRPMTRAELKLLGTRVERQKAKQENKRKLELQREIARTLAQALSLLFEELKCEGSSSIGLLAKFCDMYPDGENRYKDLFALCALGIDAAERQLPEKSSNRRSGRKSDGLSAFIKCFAGLVHAAGGRLTAPFDPDTGRGTITPFVIATKLVIDALPGDCPKLTECAIADRIRDEKLLTGMTGQTSAPRKSRSTRKGAFARSCPASTAKIRKLAPLE